jgi:ribosome production factor 2
MPKTTGEDLVEKVKNILFLKGRNSSQVVNDAMRDLGLLSKPYNKVFSKKNDISPFEDSSSLEFLAPKNDCGLFVFGSHSKKRPDNLVMGRVYEGQLLDMYEFGIEQLQSLSSFAGDKKSVGAKPMMVFLGSQWEFDVNYQRLQNLFLDVFRGFKPDKISLHGVDHVISCAIHEDKIYIRPYFVNYQRSSAAAPSLSLQPMGPFLDLTLRRSQPAAEDLWKLACRKPKLPNQAPKVKNIVRNDLGDKVARVHMKRQNFDSLGGRRMNALRKKRSFEGEENDNKKKQKK